MNKQNLEEVLKNLYTNIITDQLNNRTSPFFSAIKSGNDFVCGKDIVFSMGNETATIALNTLYLTLEIPNKVIEHLSPNYSTIANIISTEADTTLENGKKMLNEALFGDTKLCGLKYLFDNSKESIYGIKRTKDNVPLEKATMESSFVDKTTQTINVMLDKAEKRNTETNMIITSFRLRRALTAYLNEHKINIDYMSLSGGFKSLSYNGIPIIADKFCPENEMYFLNTKDFMIQQLCDWYWIESEKGEILHRVDNNNYTATLAKYTNLICTNPYGQAKLTVDFGG